MRGKKRTYKPLNEEQLTILKEKNGLVTLKELAELVNLPYTNLSGTLTRYNIKFTPKRVANYRMPDNNKMALSKNSKGEKILTDNLMKEWFDY